MNVRVVAVLGGVAVIAVSLFMFATKNRADSPEVLIDSINEPEQFVMVPSNRETSDIRSEADLVFSTTLEIPTNDYFTLDSYLSNLDYSSTTRFADIYGSVKAAALDGDPDAAANMYMMVKTCIAVPLDEDALAFQIEQQSQNYNDPTHVRSMLRDPFERCLFVPREDEELAYDTLEAAALSGGLGAMALYSQSPPFFQDFDPEVDQTKANQWDVTSFDVRQQLAKQGHVDAYFQLAQQYLIAEAMPGPANHDPVTALGYLLALRNVQEQPSADMEMDIDRLSENLSAEERKSALAIAVDARDSMMQTGKGQKK